MFIESDELSDLLQVEQDYIDELKKRWGNHQISDKAEKALRMGKRTELLGDLQWRKERPSKGE